MKDTDRKRLYTYVPYWMIKLLEKKRCTACKHSISRTDIRAIGIRELKEGPSTYYLEYACSACNKAVIINMNREKSGTPEDLCYDLIEQMQRNRKIDKARKVSSNRKGYIRDKEVEDLIKFMENAESHEDFLRYIGAHEEIPPSDED